MLEAYILCPYCGVKIFLEIVIKSSKLSFSFEKSIGGEDSTSSQVISHDVKCPLCGREYTFIDFNKDYSLLRKNFLVSNTMLSTLRSKFQQVRPQDIFNNVMGVAKPMADLRNFYRRNHLHICFILYGKRCYVDCEINKGRYRGLNIYEV